MADLLLDENNDLMILAGDFVIGESDMQEVGQILSTNQGEWKEEPLLGANLVTKVRSNPEAVKLERSLRIQLKMDNKDYDRIREKIKINYQ